MYSRRLGHTISTVILAGILALELGAAEIRSRNSNRHPGECVVLLHGLGRSSLCMKPLEWYLHLHGYEVVNLSYPSRRLSIPELGCSWLPKKLEERVGQQARVVHFVTHSMGGIVVRQYLQACGTNNVGRVVMLAPPNHGSEVAERLLRGGLLLKLFGPAGRELGIGRSSVPKRLGQALVETGVVAANRSLNPVFSRWLPGADDGRVTVASTRLEGMRGHLTITSTHSGVLLRPAALKAVLRFLETGSFDSAAQNL